MLNEEQRCFRPYGQSTFFAPYEIYDNEKALRQNMNLLDIVGSVMVGPSSSHTAGAVKIGLVSRKLMGESITNADIYFHGSFLSTGKGYGTDRAILAGLLGYGVDDPVIPHSFEAAKKAGLHYSMKGIDLGEVHPNSVKMFLTGESG